MSPSKDDIYTLTARFAGALGRKMRERAEDRGIDMTNFKPGYPTGQHAPDAPLDIRPDFVPSMGFQEETYVPGHPAQNSTGWAHFYTCIANGKRVYVWAFSANSRDTCCVMLSDNEYDPQRGAAVAELQHMFARQHNDQRGRSVSRTHRLPCDPLLVQAFIHRLTLGGNHETD